MTTTLRRWSKFARLTNKQRSPSATRIVDNSAHDICKSSCPYGPSRSRRTTAGSASAAMPPHRRSTSAKVCSGNTSTATSRFTAPNTCTMGACTGTTIKLPAVIGCKACAAPSTAMSYKSMIFSSLPGARKRTCRMVPVLSMPPAAESASMTDDPAGML